MESLDLQVLHTARNWFQGGYTVNLFTVVETWGSAPRPPGALLAIRDDGLVAGSVSGGCVEDDLITQVRSRQNKQGVPRLLTYGVTKDEAARFGLPCGGTLRLAQEQLSELYWLDAVLQRIEDHQCVQRSLDMDTGVVSIDMTAIQAPQGNKVPFLDGTILRTWFGPRWRLLIIGAGQLSRILAQMAMALDYEVLVCDPREEYSRGWDMPNVPCLTEMPDDVVLDMGVDMHTAIAALTHDPKLDDMALLEALKSSAFYVGALGSRVSNMRRRERLALFDIDSGQIERLHGPIGLHIGSRVPSEIAISILAEITAVKNGVRVSEQW